MAAKIEVPYEACLKETLDVLGRTGLLLVSRGRQGKPNVMAIGWGTVGTVWGRPVFVVLVRPSRHTHALLEESGDFTVNVMPEEMREVVEYCGTVSGRDHDKFAEKGLAALDGLRVEAPIIGESRVAYECRTLLRTHVLPERLDADIRRSAYPSGDFHTIYFGQILAVRAEEDALAQAGRAGG